VQVSYEPPLDLLVCGYTQLTLYTSQLSMLHSISGSVAAGICTRYMDQLVDAAHWTLAVS